MKKLIICAIMILMFISCDLVNTGIPDFIATHGSGSTSAVAPVIVTDLSTDEMTYTQNNPATPLTIEATVTDGGTLTYAWYSNDAANSETPTNLETDPLTTTYAPLTTALGTLYYYCEVTNTKDGGVATSKFAKITVNNKVNAEAPVIKPNLSTDEVTYTLNDAATALTIKATSPDGGALTYVWYSNNEDNKETPTKLQTKLQTETDPLITTYTPSTKALGTLYYYCEVTNTIEDDVDVGEEKATTTSKFAKITVNPITFTATQKGGISGSVTTTGISILFNKAITLTADHITLTGATKGELTGTGTTYTIAISDFKVVNGETVKVVISVPGYTINPDSRDAAVIVVTAVTPEISPNGGNFDGSQEITITSTTDGAEIYYTTDGIDPTTESTQYTEESIIGGATALDGTVVVKAIAVKAGMLNSTVAITKTFTKKRVLATVLVESAGKSFDVGAPVGTSNTNVTFTKDFYMGESEVTQGQYYDVMTELEGENGEAGSRRPSSHGKDDTTTDAWRDLPVEKVTWFNAIAFCNALSEAEGLAAYYTIVGTTVTIGTGLGYRLPTEAEWEYAAGGGATRTIYAGTSDEGDLGTYAWYGDNNSNTTHAVKGKSSNTLGLYDMSGNVWELCWDWSDKYPSSDEDPTGSVTGTKRVSHGGSYSDNADNCRVAIRIDFSPGLNHSRVGFRVVRLSQE